MSWKASILTGCTKYCFKQVSWDGIEPEEWVSINPLVMNFSPVTYLQYLFLCMVFNENKVGRNLVTRLCRTKTNFFFEFSWGLYQLQRNPETCKGIWGAVNPHPAELILWKEKNLMDKRRWENNSMCNPACVLGMPEPGSSTTASSLKRLQNCIQIKTFHSQFAWVPRRFWD